MVLVPSGLLIMFGYHLFLLYRCLKVPETTVLCYENHCRKAWIERTLQVEIKERNPCVAVVSSTISAATFFASTSLALSSLIGAWVGTVSKNFFQSSLIYGNKSESMITLKYISLLLLFLVAYVCFLQCIGCLVLTNFLLTMPNCEVPVEHVKKVAIQGNVFWSVGFRAIYFATSLLLWFFGPIPMFVSSVTMVLVLHMLDTNSTPFHQFQPAQSRRLLCRNDDNCSQYSHRAP